MKLKIEYIETTTDGHDFLVDRPLRDLLKKHFNGKVSHTVGPKPVRGGVSSTIDLFNLFNTNEMAAKEEFEKFAAAQPSDTKCTISMDWLQIEPGAKVKLVPVPVEEAAAN